MKLKVLICIRNNLWLVKFILGLIEEFYLLPTDYMIDRRFWGKWDFIMKFVLQVWALVYFYYVCLYYFFNFAYLSSFLIFNLFYLQDRKLKKRKRKKKNRARLA